MKRRKFIKKTGTLGIATIIPVSSYSIMTKQLFEENKGPKITPKQYGAVGDGVADDTQALKDWMNWAMSSEDTQFYFDKRANYLVTDGLVIEAEKTFFLNGRNSKITRDFSNIEGVGNKNVLKIMRNQNIIIRSTLAADIAKGDTYFVVDDATGVEVGMGVRCDAETYIEYVLEQVIYRKGFMSIVTSIDGNTISVADPMPSDFTIAGSGTDTIRFATVNPVKVENLELDGFNHLGLYRAGDSKLLLLSEIYNFELDNISFATPARGFMELKRVYNGTINNITTTHGVTSQGIYGLIMILGVKLQLTNVDVDAYSHSFVPTISGSYGIVLDQCNFRANGFTAFDSHFSLGVTVTNSEWTGMSWGFGVLDISNCVLKLSNGLDALITLRASTSGGDPNNIIGERSLEMNIQDSTFESTGEINLFESGGYSETPQNTNTLTNNVYNNEDIIIPPYKSTIIESGNRMVLTDKTYDLPLNNSWTNVWTGNYYDLTAAAEAIATPINLSGVTAFSFFTKVKLEDLSDTTEPLFSFGGNRMWFRLNKTNNRLDVRLRDVNNNFYDMNVRYIFDENIRTYGITFDAAIGLRFYVDGFFVGSKPYTAGPLLTDATNLVIGQRSASLFSGDIKAVKYFDRKLSQEEVVSMAIDPNTVSDYKMYLGPNKTNTVWFDESSNENNGTVGDAIVLVP